MSIEFNCSQCGKLLRVGDDAAGKQARCPSCQTVQEIPSAVPSAQGAFGIAPPSAQRATAADSEVNPYQAPLGSGTLEPNRAMAQPVRGPIRPTIIGVLEPIESAWNICKENFMQLVMCLVAMIICFAINYVSQLLFQGVIGAVGAVNPPIVVVITMFIAVWVALVVFQTWIGIGQTMFFLKTARGEEVSLAILFGGGPYLLSAIIVALLISIVILAPGGVVGLIVYAATRDPAAGLFASMPLFFLISIYVGLTYFPYYFLIPDQGLGPLESLRVSKQITSGNRLTIFLLGLLTITVGLISVLLCCVPFLFTLPFIMLTATVAYLQMAGQVTADRLHLERPTETPFSAPTPELR